jgi:hypothetical protein
MDGQPQYVTTHFAAVAGATSTIRRRLSSDRMNNARERQREKLAMS